jgi:hypothetical protein
MATVEVCALRVKRQMFALNRAAALVSRSSAAYCRARDVCFLGLATVSDVPEAEVGSRTGGSTGTMADHVC